MTSTLTPRRLTSPFQHWLAEHRPHRTRHHGALVGDRGGPSKALATIRRRRPADHAACGRLLGLVALHDPLSLPEGTSPRSWLESSDVMAAWVAERQGEILGHVALARPGQGVCSALRWREVTGLETSRMAEISRFFVRTRVRGHGLGRELVEVAASEAWARGLTPVVEVVAGPADDARLFEALGWRHRSMSCEGSGADRRVVHMYVATRP